MDKGIRVIGGEMRIGAVYEQEDPHRILAQSSQGGPGAQGNPRGLSNLDLEARLVAALRAKFEQRGPTGEIVTPAPPLFAFWPDSQEVAYVQPDGRLAIAPYLLNSDTTATIGQGVPALTDIIKASAVPSRELQRALTMECNHFQGPGESGPKIVELGPKAVVAQLGGRYIKFNHGFSGDTCLLIRGREVERQSGKFAEPGSIDPSAELHAVTVELQAALRAQGRDVDYGTCQIAAAKALATPKADREREFSAILAMLFSKKS